MIRMPFMGGKISYDDSFTRIIDRVARRMGMSQYEVAILLTHVFENIINEVAYGKTVNAVGFGMWGAVGWRPKVKTMEPFAAPRFSPSRVFRNNVRATCPAHPNSEAIFKAFNRSHHVSSKPEQQRSMAFMAFRAMRERLRAQSLRNEGRRLSW